MRLLLYLKGDLNMCKGYGYAIRSLFGSMLLGIFTSSIIEIVVVKGLDFLSRYGLTKIDYNFGRC